jgi:DNA repair exonuclease SbcCD ATPase subunit
MEDVMEKLKAYLNEIEIFMDKLSKVDQLIESLEDNNKQLNSANNKVSKISELKEQLIELGDSLSGTINELSTKTSSEINNYTSKLDNDLNNFIVKINEKVDSLVEGNEKNTNKINDIENNIANLMKLIHKNRMILIVNTIATLLVFLLVLFNIVVK